MEIAATDRLVLDAVNQLAVEYPEFRERLAGRLWALARALPAAYLDDFDRAIWSERPTPDEPEEEEANDKTAGNVTIKGVEFDGNRFMLQISV